MEEKIGLHPNIPVKVPPNIEDTKVGNKHARAAHAWKGNGRNSSERNSENNGFGDGTSGKSGEISGFIGLGVEWNCRQWRKWVRWWN